MVQARCLISPTSSDAAGTLMEKHFVTIRTHFFYVAKLTDCCIVSLTAVNIDDSKQNIGHLKQYAGSAENGEEEDCMKSPKCICVVGQLKKEASLPLGEAK